MLIKEYKVYCKNVYIYFFAEFYLITLFNVLVTSVKIDYPYNVRMSEDQSFKQI